MTKPFSDQSACGCHLHVSLVSRTDGQNAFLDLNDPDGLSNECRCFIQGMLDHAPASMALMAPTPNCYHRFVPHHFAPSNVSWGLEDRTAMVRAKSSRDASTHLENRAPTALSNPYLAMAAVIAGGLLGLQRGRPALTPVAGLGPAEERDGYQPLPRSLEESLAAFEADRELADLLGDEFTRVYTTVRRFELDRFRSHVTDWERNEYLELY
jgi:glutamine synthetase